VSVSSAQATAFFNEVLAVPEVWALRDDEGYPSFQASIEHYVAIPFWSKESRARRITTNVEGFDALAVVSIPLDVWRERWLPGMARESLRVGINWSGPRATGYDYTPDEVGERLAVMEKSLAGTRGAEPSVRASERSPLVGRDVEVGAESRRVADHHLAAGRGDDQRTVVAVVERQPGAWCLSR
jgi:hypothetical protein